MSNDTSRYFWGYKDLNITPAVPGNFQSDVPQLFEGFKEYLDEAIRPDKAKVDKHKDDPEMIRKVHDESAARPMTPQHQSAIHKYKAFGGFKQLNKSLRNGLDIISDHKKMHERLSDLTSNKTEHDFHVYRGFKHDVKLFKNMEPGTVFKDKAYISTSMKRQVASSPSFSRPGRTGIQHVARIHVTPGTKGHYLDHVNTGFTSEHEFLLHPGTSFKVHSHTYDRHNKIHYINLNIHHQD